MSDNTTTDVQEEVAPIKETRLVYPYKSLTGVGANLQVYTGAPLEIDADADTPASACVWKPPTVGDGLAVYFDGFGWVVARDITKMALDDLKELLLTDAATQFLQDTDALNAEYPRAERDSWSTQSAQAQIVLEGGESPMLTALASARGVDVKALAQKILDKANAYNTAYAKLLGAYQAQRDAVNAVSKVVKMPPVSLHAMRS